MNRRRMLLGSITGATVAAVHFLFPGFSEAMASTARTSADQTTGRVSRMIAGPTGETRTIHSLSGDDPSFAQGIVVQKMAGSIVLDADGRRATVRLTSGMTVWKEFDVSPEAVNLGDWIDAKGERLSDGSLLVSSGGVFVNIGRRDGTLLETKHDRLSVREKTGHQREWELSQRVEFVRFGTSGETVRPDPQGFSTGERVGAVGLRLPNSGFRATRVWVYPEA